MLKIIVVFLALFSIIKIIGIVMYSKTLKPTKNELETYKRQKKLYQSELDELKKEDDREDDSLF
ncbi:hypothetical protein HMPREF9318_01437 [Streptococcus urinalis FB127-CNA-2]|uniref:Uncharacterized protein n=1 Tax=Streptococcus urinalis 2285-97 TaxID=764291 RepID=G5KD96_9STRE|nr:hypothetical protein [Streptococcus urinalis]EHJ56460.1 hypothetical protein STRUR_0616 [Streptococcus urinalis 2285-97]EKS19361.1 hypothetical protein HMPREF9318_01437 [Streptococcus urinalis FB127-CNA-2]VEF31491.1 Uncharacterised protein [Streptococcus urinalis]